MSGQKTIRAEAGERRFGRQRPVVSCVRSLNSAIRIAYCGNPWMKWVVRSSGSMIDWCALLAPSPTMTRQPDPTLRERPGRLAALIPPPRRHRPRDDGALAGNSPLRSAITALAVAHEGRACRGRCRDRKSCCPSRGSPLWVAAGQCGADPLAQPSVERWLRITFPYDRRYGRPEALEEV